MKMADAVQQLKAHWNDLANRCMRDNRPYFTDFLPAEDTAMAEAIANTAGAVCTAWGGTENTTRVILCFAPDFIPVTPEQFPIQCLTFSYRVPKPPTHRDFLGACMACNLERDTIGDILIEDGTNVRLCPCGSCAFTGSSSDWTSWCQRDGR